jgi:hypothetical protein
MTVNVDPHGRDFINLARCRTVETRKRTGGYL